MALTNNGTKVSVKGALPTGYTKPTVTEFSDYEYETTKEFTIAKSAVENADPATTMTNILNDAAVGVTKQVSDLITADLDVAGNTVDVWADLVKISNNQERNDSTFFDNTAAAYVCRVKIYVKTS